MSIGVEGWKGTPAGTKDGTTKGWTTTTGAGARECPADTMEDWSMTLQRGLTGLLLWQQSIWPDMDFMEQAVAVDPMA